MIPFVKIYFLSSFNKRVKIIRHFIHINRWHINLCFHCEDLYPYLIIYFFSPLLVKIYKCVFKMVEKKSPSIKTFVKSATTYENYKTVKSKESFSVIYFISLFFCANSFTRNSLFKSVFFLSLKMIEMSLHKQN